MSSFPPPPPPLGNSMDPVDPRGPVDPGHRNQQVFGTKPKNYLVWAILATICCCLPTGIAAIVYAAQVDSKWNGGDYAGASEASEKAKLWSLISLVVGFVAMGVYTIIGVMGGLDASY